MVCGEGETFVTQGHVEPYRNLAMLSLGQFGLCKVATVIDLNASTVHGESEDSGAQSQPRHVKFPPFCFMQGHDGHTIWISGNTPAVEIMLSDPTNGMRRAPACQNSIKW